MSQRHESSATVGELLLQLGQRTGLASQGATSAAALGLPSDPATVKLLRDAFMAGVNRVARFRTWSWMTPRVEVTCDPTGQSPDCVASHPGDYWVTRDAARTVSKTVLCTLASGGSAPVPVVTSERLERARASSATVTGRPSLVAFVYQRPKSDGDRVRDRVVLKVFPKPDAAHVLSFIVKRDMPTLIELTERPFWPVSVDEAVLTAAVEHMARYGMTATQIDLGKAEEHAARVLVELAAEDRKAQAAIMDSKEYAGVYLGTPGIINDDGTIITG